MHITHANIVIKYVNTQFACIYKKLKNEKIILLSFISNNLSSLKSIGLDFINFVNHLKVDFENKFYYLMKYVGRLYTFY